MHDTDEYGPETDMLGKHRHPALPILGTALLLACSPALADTATTVATPVTAAPAAGPAATAVPDATTTPRVQARGLAPRSAAINGGVVILPLPAGSAGQALYYQGNPVWTGRLKAGGDRVAVIGVGLDSDGEQALHSTPDNDPATQVASFTVSRQPYPEQRLTLTQTQYVNPDPVQLERFAREAAEQKAAYRVHSPAGADARWPTFRWPLTGRLSSPFGLRRFFNDEPRAPHLGLDIAGATGTPAVAPADGRVALTGDYFFNGRTVIIDHGQGLYSMLCHFSKVLVKTGDAVKAGQPVGLVGATGRATGPHLHWTVSLNDMRVDPRWLLPGD